MTFNLTMAQIPQPTTTPVALAVEVSEQFCSPALVAHCRRSYLFAASFGLLHGIEFDAELLFVASMLHDIGLVTAFDNHTIPFEEAGGHVGWVFAAGAGWPPARRRRVGEIVVHHMQHVDPAADPEGHLLAVATSLDISGQRPEAWPTELLTEIVAAIPRGGLRPEFVACFQDQATRKPRSTAANSFRTGLADRMKANPLERLLGQP